MSAVPARGATERTSPGSLHCGGRDRREDPGGCFPVRRTPGLQKSGPPGCPGWMAAPVVGIAHPSPSVPAGTHAGHLGRDCDGLTPSSNRSRDSHPEVPTCHGRI
jgi:hypothetical protein